MEQCHGQLGLMAVSQKTRCIVWAKAAGRCQFPGCNKLLVGDLVAGNDTLNLGYIAHIVADSPKGPRGDEVRSPLLSDDPENIMLLCDPHHRLIDRDEVDNYPEIRLLEIKREAERRIVLATGVARDRSSQIVRFAATIGENEGVVSFSNCREAMLPDFYPVDKRPIDLSLGNFASAESEAGFYKTQIHNLRRQFQRKLDGLAESQSFRHYSVFALAPIPLLMELGRLLSDITPVEVYQLHREPAGWSWAEQGARLQLSRKVPKTGEGPVALRLELSARIEDDRIKAVLGDAAQIWSVSASEPHNDAMRFREDLGRFRSDVRAVLAQIKERSGEGVPVHVFPAIPVSAAVEFGRVWMPKADLALRIYDQSREEGGFVERLHFGGVKT